MHSSCTRQCSTCAEVLQKALTRCCTTVHACVLLQQCSNDAVTVPGCWLGKTGVHELPEGFIRCAAQLFPATQKEGSRSTDTPPPAAQVTECVSAIFAGAAFDGLRLSATMVVLIMAGVAAVTAVAWVAYAMSQWPRRAVDPGHAPEQDQEELLPSGSL